MKPRVPPLLRPRQRFATERPEPDATDDECPECGQWLDPAGECEDCDHDDE